MKSGFLLWGMTKKKLELWNIGSFLFGVILISLLLLDKNCWGNQLVTENSRERIDEKLILASSDEVQKKYHWLLKEKPVEPQTREMETTTVIEKLDREIKSARKIYLSGEIENAILKYRSAIDQLEALIEDIPPGHVLLNEIDQRFQLFDELATKLLGPLHMEPREDLAPALFHLFEKRRLCKRNLVIKKAGHIRFFDVPESLLQEESDLLGKLIEIQDELPSPQNREAEAALKSALSNARKSLHKSSPRYSMLRRGVAVSLADLRKDLLSNEEMILDFNLLPDRMVVGMITNEKAIYYQISVNRSEIDKNVLNFQEKLKEHAAGDRSTFMGHAWKEPCRRIYRSLFGKLPSLPSGKPKILVIPDRSLWYLPMSATMDSEDRPFGKGHFVTYIPSVDFLKFLRSSSHSTKSNEPVKLVLFESLPWISEADIQDRQSAPTRKKASKRLSEEEKIEHLILSNPVYPKPSDVVVKIQKMFEKSEVFVGPAATLDHFLEPKEKFTDVVLLAVPIGVTDNVVPDKQPNLFFSPDKRNLRKLEASRLFSTSLAGALAIMPVAWFEIQDKESISGEGPLLLSVAMHYAGIKMSMINYSDPNWGTEASFLLSVLKNMGNRISPPHALTEYSRELTSGLDSSFSGKPPSWTGWIYMGDPS